MERRTRRPGPTLLAGLLALELAGTACTASSDALRADETDRGAPTRRHEVLAPIVGVSLRVAESQPPQYFADVTSALEDGCARFARAAVRREGDTVQVEVWNSRPHPGARIACPMIYGEQETSIALGSDFVAGRHYVLDVNGTRQTFEGQ